MKKNETLDTFIAVGSFDHHANVELFTLSSSKWQIKKKYDYTIDISQYAILAVEKKFYIFGGRSAETKVLTNQDINTVIIPIKRPLIKRHIPKNLKMVLINP